MRSYLLAEALAVIAFMSMIAIAAVGAVYFAGSGIVAAFQMIWGAQ